MSSLVLDLVGASVAVEDVRRSASGMILCTMTPRFVRPDARIPARECAFRPADFDSMIRYLREHIGANTPHAIEDSMTFVTHEMDFQLQALCGELESWSAGSFTLRWMFCSGPPDRAEDAIYLGFETEVGVAEVLRWCVELESAVARLDINPQ